MTAQKNFKQTESPYLPQTLHKSILRELHIPVMQLCMPMSTAYHCEPRRIENELLPEAVGAPLPSGVALEGFVSICVSSLSALAHSLW